MPNWCENKITISGPKSLIKKLYNEIDLNKNHFLEVFCPIGEWDYDKAVKTWGTKWDANDGSFGYSQESDEYDVGHIDGTFESAWSPPIEAFRTFCEQHEDCVVVLSYFEPGMGYIGEWSSVDGDESWEIGPSNFDGVPLHLVEEFDLNSCYVETEEV